MAVAEEDDGARSGQCGLELLPNQEFGQRVLRGRKEGKEDGIVEREQGGRAVEKTSRVEDRVVAGEKAVAAADGDGAIRRRGDRQRAVVEELRGGLNLPHRAAGERQDDERDRTEADRVCLLAGSR